MTHSSFFHEQSQNYALAANQSFYSISDTDSFIKSYSFYLFVKADRWIESYSDSGIMTHITRTASWIVAFLSRLALGILLSIRGLYHGSKAIIQGLFSAFSYGAEHFFVMYESAFPLSLKKIESDDTSNTVSLNSQALKKTLSQYSFVSLSSTKSNQKDEAKEGVDASPLQDLKDQLSVVKICMVP